MTHQAIMMGGVTRGLKKRTLSNRFSRFQKSTIRSVKKPDTHTKTTTTDRRHYQDDEPNNNSANEIIIDDDDDDDDGDVDITLMSNMANGGGDNKQSDEIPLYENFRQFSTIGEEKEDDDNEM